MAQARDEEGYPLWIVKLDVIGLGEVVFKDVPAHDAEEAIDGCKETITSIKRNDISVEAINPQWLQDQR